MTASQIFIFVLILIAAIVACGLMRKKNMWKWIIAYWVVLTIKNLCDALKL